MPILPDLLGGSGGGGGAVETPNSIKTKLETLTGDNRLSVHAVRGAVQVVHLDGGPAIIDPSTGLPVSLTDRSFSTNLKLLGGAKGANLGANADGHNCYAQIPAIGVPIAVRARIRNYSTSTPLIMEGMKVATDDQNLSSENWASSHLTWSGFLQFSGSQSVTVPAGKAGLGVSPNDIVIPGISDWSDWMPVGDKPRVDVPGAPRLFRFAAHYPTNSVVLSYAPNRLAGLNSDPLNPGLTHGLRVAQAPIAQLTSNGLTMTTGGSIWGIGDIEFMYAEDRPKSLYVFGDSTFEGAQENGPMFMSYQSVTQGKPIAVSNYAVSGQILEDSLAMLKATLDGKTYVDYCYFSAYSENNTPMTQASVNALRVRVLDVISWLSKQRIMPVIRTPVASSGSNAALMEQQDAWVRSLAGVAIVDLRAMSTSDWTLKPEYSVGDGTHFNRAAYLYEAGQLSNALSI